MAKLTTSLAIAGAVAAATGLGAGGSFLAMKMLTHARTMAVPAAHASVPPPQPIFFADLSDVTVSIPPQPGAPATSYVEFGIQFATYNSNALTDFSALQPIIKADIINLLMSQTSSALQQPGTRVALIQNCLAAANSVVQKDALTTGPAPFNAAYITNLVIQD